ncbi:hypothetical protein Bca4012_098460 [Brassica carinata]
MAIISDGDGDNENPNGGDGEGDNTVRSEAQVSILTEAAVDLESGEARELSLVLNPSALVLAEVSDLVEVGQQQEVKEPVEFATIPQVSKAVGGEGHSIEELIQDLEALTPHSIPVEPVRTTTPPTGQEIDEGQGSKSREESQGIQLSEPTTEVFHTNKEGRWETDNGRKKVLVMERKQREEKGIVISPSRFSPLQGIEEEEEEEYEEVGKEIE